MNDINCNYPCDCCGKIFRADRCKIEEVILGKRKHIFCSRECFNAHKKPKIETIQTQFSRRNYTLLSDEYINNRQKLKYLCKKHADKGVQYISFTSFTRGSGCKYCGREKTANGRRLDFSYIQQKFAEWELILVSEDYKNNSTKLKFICRKHETIGMQEKSFTKLVKSNGQCNHCSRSSEKRKKYSLSFARELFEKNDLHLLESNYDHVRKLMAYICNKHPDEGVQYKHLYSLIEDKNGCRICKNEKIAKAQKMTEEEFHQRIFKIHENELINIENYINANTKIKFSCRLCGNVWSALPNNIIYGEQGCPSCIASHGEKSIVRFLKKKKFAFMQHKKFDGLVGVNGGYLSYDFYLPEYHFLIEYQGEYHDGTAGNQTPEEFEKQKEHDRRKRDYARKNKIPLLEIWYWDYKNIHNILEQKYKELA